MKGFLQLLSVVVLNRIRLLLNHMNFHNQFINFLKFGFSSCISIRSFVFIHGAGNVLLPAVGVDAADWISVLGKHF